MKDKLRKWLYDWLIGGEINKLKDENRIIFDALTNLKIKYSELEKDLNLIKSTCDIGVDVHERTDSWAVICIAGKKEYVKFVKLESRDARDVMHFLKRFEPSNSRLIDAPFAHTDFLKW